MARLQFWMFLLFLPALGMAQQANRQHYTGLNLGVSVIQEDLREGYAYQPFTLLAETSLWLIGPVSVYAEGQFVYADTPIEPGAVYETGLNMGFRYQAQLSERWLLPDRITSPSIQKARRRALSFLIILNWAFLISHLPETGASICAPVFGTSPMPASNTRIWAWIIFLSLLAFGNRFSPFAFEELKHRRSFVVTTTFCFRSEHLHNKKTLH